MTEYLTPKDEKAVLRSLADSKISVREKARLARTLSLKNYSSEISLLACCLMPNHFHLFLKQKTADAVPQFMNSIGNRYAVYFNHAHDRAGTLFQGVYKAVLVSDEAHYLHITRYIHQQALNTEPGDGSKYPSSYPEYLGLMKTEWVHPEEMLAFFSATNPSFSYKSFIEDKNPLYQITDREFEV